jgi:hypothetical protein
VGDDERRHVMRDPHHDPALTDDELVRRRVAWFAA